MDSVLDESCQAVCCAETTTSAQELPQPHKELPQLQKELPQLQKELPQLQKEPPQLQKKIPQLEKLMLQEQGRVLRLTMKIRQLLTPAMHVIVMQEMELAPPLCRFFPFSCLLSSPAFCS